MAPKKKGGAKQPQLTPEQMEAKRAAIMAQFNQGGTKPAAAPKAAPKAAAPAAAPPSGELEALSVADKAAAPIDVSDSNAGDDVLGSGAALTPARLVEREIRQSDFATELPSGWARMLTIEPMPAQLKAAKKQGECAAVEGGKIYHHKNVAYLFDAEGRTNAACWRTQFEGANLGTGAQPMCRACGAKLKLVVGKDKLMAKAIAAQTKCELTPLLTGHVLVLGGEEACEEAMGLIDDLVDGDGEATRAALAARLVVAEPWCGHCEVACPEEWVGAVIGKGGKGLKAIADESGAKLDYVDPEEQEAAAKAAAEQAAAKAEQADEAAGAGAAGAVGAAGAAGHFRIVGREHQCALAAKRLEERLALVQRLDVHSYVMVPRAAVGRLIGKAGANIKLLQRTSGASRITFEKEGGASQACAILAPDLEASVGAGLEILKAVPLPNPEAKEELTKRLEDWEAACLALGGDEAAAAPPAMRREQAVEWHKRRYPPAAAEAQPTKEKPAELAAVDFDVWLWQWAVESRLVHADGGGRRK